MRRIEERLVADDGSPIEEWGPSSDAPRDMRYMTDREVAAWIRAENRRRRDSGSNIRLRSVDEAE